MSGTHDQNSIVVGVSSALSISAWLTGSTVVPVAPDVDGAPQPTSIIAEVAASAPNVSTVPRRITVISVLLMDRARSTLLRVRVPTTTSALGDVITTNDRNVCFLSIRALLTR